MPPQRHRGALFVSVVARTSHRFSSLLRFGSADVRAASEDLTFHGFLNIGPSAACRNVKRRVECIYLEDIVMVWMPRRRRRSHVLRTTQTVLICAGRDRPALRDRRARSR